MDRPLVTEIKDGLDDDITEEKRILIFDFMEIPQKALTLTLFSSHYSFFSLRILIFDICNTRARTCAVYIE